MLIDLLTDFVGQCKGAVSLFLQVNKSIFIVAQLAAFLLSALLAGGSVFIGRLIYRDYRHSVILGILAIPAFILSLFFFSVIFSAHYFQDAAYKTISEWCVIFSGDSKSTNTDASSYTFSLLKDAYYAVQNEVINEDGSPIKLDPPPTQKNPIWGPVGPMSPTVEKKYDEVRFNSYVNGMIRHFVSNHHFLACILGWNKSGIVTEALADIDRFNQDGDKTVLVVAKVSEFVAEELRKDLADTLWRVTWLPVIIMLVLIVLLWTPLYASSAIIAYRHLKPVTR